MPGSLISSLLGSSSSTSVDQFASYVAAMTLYKKYEFGKSVVKDQTNTPIRNVTDLAVDFNPYSESAGQIIINKEPQRYKDFSNAANFVFTADALELTAVHGQAPVLTASPTASVEYSRTVTIPDATNVKIGQLIGLGKESYKNLHRIITSSITTPSAGDVITHTFTHVRNAANGGFDPVSIVVTSAGDASADAASFVSQINADPTLQNWKITALVMPGVPGGFLFSFPKFSDRSSDDYGDDGKGSIAWVTRSFTKVGNATLLTPQNVSGYNYVVSKSGNTLTLAHPVSLNTDSVITFNPSYALEIGATGTTGDIQRVLTGDFSADQDWTKGAGWTISGGVANATTSSANLDQTIPNLIQGMSYSITYTVTRSAGSVRPYLGGTAGTSRSASGTYTETIVAGAGTTLTFTGTGFTGTLDNISMKGVNTYKIQDVSMLSVGMSVACSYQDSNLRKISGIDTVNNVIFVSGGPYMQAGHWLTAYPVYQATINASGTSTVLNFSSVPAGVAIGQTAFNYYASGVTGDIRVVGVTSTTVTLNTTITVTNGDTFFFFAPVTSGQIWSKFSLAPGLDGYSTIAGEIIAEFPNAADIAAWPAFWCYTNTNDPSPTPGMGDNSEIDWTDTFHYWNNPSCASFLPACGASGGGTAQSGSSNKIVLKSTCSAFDGDYVGLTINITSGTGSGQSRTIVAYNGATKEATVSSPWVTIPNNTSVYSFTVVNTYTHPDQYPSSYLRGNNLGRKERRLGFTFSANIVRFFLDGVLIRECVCTWSKWKRAQFGVNLAVGSVSTNFNSNGFFPFELSVFPMKFKVKQLSFWTA